MRVPVLSVSRINGQFFIYVAEQGEKDKSLAAHQRQVQLGDIVGNDYIVLSGLKPGDRVITSGTQFLSEGAAVIPKAS